MENLRISCAALASIHLSSNPGLFLLGLKLKELSESGKKLLVPLGGALKFLPSARATLDQLVIEYQKEDDFRLVIQGEKLSDFETFFNSGTHREMGQGMFRELHEELVDEYHALTYLTTSDVQIHYSHRFQEAETDARAMGWRHNTNRYLEIYQVSFDTQIEERLGAVLQNSDVLKLVSRNEILNGNTDDGVSIASHCRSLVSVPTQENKE